MQEVLAGAVGQDKTDPGAEFAAQLFRVTCTAAFLQAQRVYRQTNDISSPAGLPLRHRPRRSRRRGSTCGHAICPARKIMTVGLDGGEAMERHGHRDQSNAAPRTPELSPHFAGTILTRGTRPKV